MKPITRQEVYLAAAAGESIQLPKPITREEIYLKQIAENGGGNGGTTNYNALSNKPQINGHELSGNKSSSDLGIPTKTSDLNNDSNFVADANYVHTDNNYDATSKGIVDGVTSALAGKADSSEIQALTNKLEDEAETRAELGAHNLLPFNLAAIKAANTSGTWSGNTYTYQGITVTFNADGTCTANGLEENEYKALGNVFVRVCSDFSYKANDKISGCPSGGNVNTYSILLTNSTATQLLAYDDGNGTSYNADVSGSVVAIRIMANTVTRNMTFKPMICRVTDSDPTWQPYAMTNVELTDAKADKSDLASISITGTTNNTGATISIGRYFYLNGVLVKAKVDIANGATLTENTNYEVVTAGALNELGYSPTLDVSESGLTIKGGKVGKLCTISITKTSDTFNQNWNTLYTLPSEFIPKYRITGLALDDSGTSSSNGIPFYIDTNGLVGVWGYSDKLTFAPMFTASYMTS